MTASAHVGDAMQSRAVPQYLTVAQSAERIFVSKATIRRWITDGTLKASKVKGILRIAETDLQRTMESHTVR